MAQSAQIAKISHRHDLLLDYMIANPTMRLRELSMHFDMTIPWLSTIINSDVFQLRLAERQDECFNATALTLRQKMVAVADQAVEKLSEQLPYATDGKFVLDVADKVLHRLGYAPSRNEGKTAASPVNNTQINHFHQTDAGTLAAAREMMNAPPALDALVVPLGENTDTNSDSEPVSEILDAETETD